MRPYARVLFCFVLRGEYPEATVVACLTNMAGKGLSGEAGYLEISDSRNTKFQFTKC